jgi:hypothetical protein
LGRRAQLSPGVGGASAAEQEGREKGTRVEAGEPPPFSPLSLSLYAGRAATGWRPARWFNRGREATRNETNGDDKTNEKHRDFKTNNCISPPLLIALIIPFPFSPQKYLAFLKFSEMDGRLDRRDKEGRPTLLEPPAQMM